MLIGLLFFSASYNTAESTVAEVNEVVLHDEPVVLGVQRCQKGVRTTHYATEPCILCQEQQEVRVCQVKWRWKVRKLFQYSNVCSSLTG